MIWIFLFTSYVSVPFISRSYLFPQVYSSLKTVCVSIGSHLIQPPSPGANYCATLQSEQNFLEKQRCQGTWEKDENIIPSLYDIQSMPCLPDLLWPSSFLFALQTQIYSFPDPSWSSSPPGSGGALSLGSQRSCAYFSYNTYNSTLVPQILSVEIQGWNKCHYMVS